MLKLPVNLTQIDQLVYSDIGTQITQYQSESISTLIMLVWITDDAVLRMKNIPPCVYTLSLVTYLKRTSDRGDSERLPTFGDECFLLLHMG